MHPARNLEPLAGHPAIEIADDRGDREGDVQRAAQLINTGLISFTSRTTAPRAPRRATKRRRT
jgi:hypothetical protein